MYSILFLIVLAAVYQADAFSSMVRSIKSNLKMLKVGEIAPDFELKNYQGKSFKLSSFKGKKPVVIFFYPADSTPGCTKEVNFTHHSSSC